MIDWNAIEPKPIPTLPDAPQVGRLRRIVRRVVFLLRWRIQITKERFVRILWSIRVR